MTLTLPVLTAKYVLQGWQVVEETDRAVLLQKPVRLKWRALTLFILSVVIGFSMGPGYGLLGIGVSSLLLARLWQKESRQRVRLVVQPDGSIHRLEIFE